MDHRGDVVLPSSRQTNLLWRIWTNQQTNKQTNKNPQINDVRLLACLLRENTPPPSLLGHKKVLTILPLLQTLRILPERSQNHRSARMQHEKKRTTYILYSMVIKSQARRISCCLSLGIPVKWKTKSTLGHSVTKDSPAFYHNRTKKKRKLILTRRNLHSHSSHSNNCFY